LKTYNVGILGFGMIGKVHAYGYLNLPLFYEPAPLRARITHVATSRPETAQAARQAVGAEVGTTDFRRITEDPAVDIVHVCTPNHLHAEALLSALRHQKHIYCDKPLVATIDEARQVAALLPDYRATAQMTFHNRFLPATMRAKELIAGGALGEVLQFRLAFLHGGSADPAAPARWKLTAAAGGGVIADLASHVLDLAEYLLGPIGSVMAHTHVAYPERPSAADPARKVAIDAEDCVLVLARLHHGVPGTIEATKLAAGIEDELRLEVHGSRGSLRFNGMDPHYLEFYDGSAPAGPLGGLRGWNRIQTGQRYPRPATGWPSPKAPIGWLRGHVACLANFLQAVADGRPGVPGLDCGIRVQHLMECLRRSAAERCWIEV
jgi:predicted dehydrogenase